MKKMLLPVFFAVAVFLCACSKTNSIDLSSLKNDNDEFCYKKINLNDSMEDAKKSLDMTLSLLRSRRERALQYTLRKRILSFIDVPAP